MHCAQVDAAFQKRRRLPNCSLIAPATVFDDSALVADKLSALLSTWLDAQTA
jgi:hypothetical protein